MSLFTVVVAFGLLLMVGLVVDGGGRLQAAQLADDTAREAARQAGQAVLAGPAVRGEGSQIDLAAARVTAEAYLVAAGVDGTVSSVGGTRVVVETSVTYTPVFLSLIGLGPQTVTGRAEARPVLTFDGAPA